MVQSLRLCTSNVGTAGLIPGQGTKIPHGAGHSQKKKKKKLVSLASHEGQLPEFRVVGGRTLLLMCLCFLSPPHSLLPKHPPTSQGSISCPHGGGGRGWGGLDHG